MDTQTRQPSGDGYDASRSTGASFNSSLLGTQQDCRHQLVHCHAANEASEDMTQDAQFKIVGKIGSSNNMKQHAI